MKEILPIWCSVLVVALTCFSIYICHWKPKSCGEKLRKQGIEGPSPSLFLGNTAQMNLMIAQISETPKIDGPFTIFPYFKHWTSLYGKLFNFALGRIQILYVSDLNIVREINCLRSTEVGKPDYLQNERGALLGKGLITTNGTIWFHQRKTIAPHLCMDNVKLDMIIHEILRLYPAATSISRKTLKDIKLGNIVALKGVNIWIWTLALHRDPGIWGFDSNLFNPERFVNGISGACKSSQAYIPFGVGARVCPGKKLAIMQLKLFLALILPNFKLKISPNYHHSPRFMLLLEPEYGVKLLIEKI